MPKNKKPCRKTAQAARRRAETASELRNRRTKARMARLAMLAAMIHDLSRAM